MGNPRDFILTVPEKQEASGNPSKAALCLLDGYVQPGAGYYYKIQIADWDGFSGDWSALFGLVNVGVSDSYEPDDSRKKNLVI